MAASNYRPGELFRRTQLQILANSGSSEENEEEYNVGRSVESNRTDLLSQTEVPESETTTRRRKASSDTNNSTNVRPAKSAKSAKSTKNPKKNMAWTPERVELLLKYLKEYQVTCNFNGKDFEQDLSAMYTEIRRCLSLDYPEEFGPGNPTEPEMPLTDMSSAEYKEYKKRLDKEQDLIKKGYDRVKEKIRNLRQDFRAAVNHDHAKLLAPHPSVPGSM